MDSILQSLSAFLACPRCGGTVTRTPKKELHCASCGVVGKEGASAFVFGNIDATPVEPRATATNMGKWSRLRIATLDFFKEQYVPLLRDKLTVLDIGVGEDQFYRLHEIPKGKITRIGLDIAAYPSAHLVADVVNGRIPLQEGSVDIVLASHVFEHLEDPLRALDDILRILKPGGYLIAATPFLLMVHQAPRDFYRYTVHGWEYLLGKSGFGNAHIVPLGRPGDVFGVATFHTARQLFDLAERTTGIRGLWERLFVKVVFNMTKPFFFLFERMGNNVPATTAYTMGYGIVAEKPKQT